jgi:hypothetical protein
MDIFWEDFNTMSFSKLCELQGIGRTTAIRIIENRPFRTKNDLFKIRGLGKKTLASFGIEKDKKSRRSWMLMDDGIEYPTTCLARHKETGKIDFFWRITKEKRQYL